MRASRAYIASFGTTGVLIAATFVLFLVVGTFLAFRGWPDSEGLPGALEPLTLDVATEAPGRADVRPVPTPARSAARVAAPASRTTAGGTAGTKVHRGGHERPRERLDRVLPRRRAPVPRRSSPAAPAPPKDERLSRTGDAVRDVSNRLDGVLRGVSPQLGDTVTRSGDAVGSLLDPLPR